MTSITALNGYGNASQPGMPATTLEPFEEHATVHAVGFDPPMQDQIGDLFRSVGLKTRMHAHLDAFAGDPSLDSGCVMVRARSALTGVMDFLSQLLRGRCTLPMIVVADRADVRMAVLAMKAGAIDFLEHPLRDHDVLEAVGRALRIDYAQRQVEAPRREWQARYARLSPRERQVMLLVAQGRLNKQVAGDLGLSEVTVKVHRSSAMRKMGARTLADLVRMADAVTASSEFGAENQLKAAPARIAVHAVEGRPRC
ncbi:DNA-binding response regulator [Croceibacterium sp. LX-88]|jgi:FixJ family two-component response regulator|uniref:DNA-binding response regulator n=1 Tax=Croceibacterium selenioxidans TaxID=2838833 RepID=A0ABS5W4D8_9SPHN|nr:LuxR C-terminal-related transcriptional regulator [Croceibacterium selenioxidans]MBT2134621.1 DNA-binding response regulator [Croceibacterium selenioxidans]